MNRSKWKSLSIMLIFAIRKLAILNIYGCYLRVNHCWRPIANVRANVWICLFAILLYCMSSAFAVVNVDILWQETYYSSYIIVGHCPWAAVLIVYLVNIVKLCSVNDFTGYEIMRVCMVSIPTYCPFTYPTLF